MDQNTAFVTQKQLERVKAALERHNMNAIVVPAAAGVPAVVEGLLAPGCTVSSGGSMTLVESGVNTLLRSGKYNFLDRDADGIDKEELQRKAFWADAYVTSANAVTERGEVLQVDGRGNRVAAIVYGPKKVILVAGCNKIVPDEEAGRRRLSQIAGPANCRRLSTPTPCMETGLCAKNAPGTHICSYELVLRHQYVEGRITVILVAEALGY